MNKYLLCDQDFWKNLFTIYKSNIYFMLYDTSCSDK